MCSLCVCVWGSALFRVDICSNLLCHLMQSADDAPAAASTRRTKQMANPAPICCHLGNSCGTSSANVLHAHRLVTGWVGLHWQACEGVVCVPLCVCGCVILREKHCGAVAATACRVLSSLAIGKRNDILRLLFCKFNWLNLSDLIRVGRSDSFAFRRKKQFDLTKIWIFRITNLILLRIVFHFKVYFKYC